MYRSRRELARDEQAYYERFYSAGTNETAVKNTVASIASLAALLLAKIRPSSHGARSLPGGPYAFARRRAHNALGTRSFVAAFAMSASKRN